MIYLFVYLTINFFRTSWNTGCRDFPHLSPPLTRMHHYLNTTNAQLFLIMPPLHRRHVFVAMLDPRQSAIPRVVSF